MNIKFSLAAIVLVVAVVTALYFWPAHQSSQTPHVAEKIPAALHDDKPDPVTTHQHAHTHDDAAEDQIAAVQAVEGPVKEISKLSPEVRAALTKMLNTSSEGLVTETVNGVTSMHLQGRFQTVPVATIDEAGNTSVTDYSHLNPGYKP